MPDKRTTVCVKLTLCSVILIASAEVLPRRAQAATRTVCFYFKIFDDARTNCPTPGTSGALLPCRPAGSPPDVPLNYGDAPGFVFQLYDKDPGGFVNDDRIGGTWITSQEKTCATFEWENAPHGEAETNPDVYIVITNQVAGTGSNQTRLVDIRMDNGTQYTDISWRDGLPGQPDLFVAENCAAATPECWIDVDPAIDPDPDKKRGFLVPFQSTATDHAQALLAAHSAQHMLTKFQPYMDPGTVWLESPAPSHCPPPPLACAGGYAWSRTLVYVNSPLDGWGVTHELGHVLQMQLFEQDVLRNDLTYPDGKNEWNLVLPEFQSGATTEGWASYLGVVSWWNPGNLNSRPKAYGHDFENPVPVWPTCSGNAYIPLQVAKAFWDLDDRRNEAGAGVAAGSDDRENYRTNPIAYKWDLFCDGEADRCDYESGPNGVNMYDYDYYYNVDNETFFDHNCLQGQEQN